MDEPVGSRVAHVAVPQDECGIRLDDLEAVLALSRLRHCVCSRFTHVSDQHDLPCVESRTLSASLGEGASSRAGYAPYVPLLGPNRYSPKRSYARRR